MNAQKVLAVILCLAMLAGCTAIVDPNALPQAPRTIEPEAGQWQTWVLESGSQIALDAPPDAEATAAEINELRAMAAERDEAALQQIAWWDAAPPSYRWGQIALDAMTKRAMPGPSAVRGLALMHAAIYDALVAAWESKYTYNRARPSQVDPSLETVIPNPESPSYPSEHAVAAGAAAAVLSWLFPEDAATFEARAQEATASRLLAGVEYPSDVEAGLELGRQVAELVIERGMADGSDAEWTGTVPTEEGKWTGENPITPTYGTWQTWVLASPDQYRPGPPPAWDSEQMAAEMEEVRSFERTPVTNSTAQFWEYAVGGRRFYWFWNQMLNRLVLEAGLAHNAPRAARAYALMNIASNDAGVACWDAKYTYWGIRPFQLDPEFTSLFPTPNHPAYPSAHSCYSAATTDILASLFPLAATEVKALAAEAIESRIWAGIHFRSDIEAGEELGHNVAAAVLERASADGSQ